MSVQAWRIRSTGNVAGEGRPPAKEITSGRSVTFRISRIAELVSFCARWEKVQDIVSLERIARGAKVRLAYGTPQRFRSLRMRSASAVQRAGRECVQHALMQRGIGSGVRRDGSSGR